jgi:restriction system-associated AAA family ATPase
MKVIRLKIFDSFRSLPANFEIRFLQKQNEDQLFQFRPYCLVGRNGSGKSNILEALASIFYHLECMSLTNLPTSFVYDEEDNPTGFSSENATIDAYELEYYFPLKWDDVNAPSSQLSALTFKNSTAHILVKKEKRKTPIITWINRNKFEDGKNPILTGLEVKKFFPDYVLGYSSGENEILSLPFFKMRFINYDEYEQALQKQLPYAQPEGRLIYFDNSFSQAVFLSNYLIQDSKVLEPIYKTLGIKGILQFRIIIRLNEIKEFIEPFEFGFDSMNSNIQDGERKKVELTSKLSDLIQVLKNCSTCWDNEEDVLTLDYCIDDEIRRAFKINFDGNPIKLFQSFQILLTLNLFEVSMELKKELYESNSLYVNETVPILASDRRITRFKNLEIETGEKSNEIYNKSLSDGEHQFLHSMGICLLFKNSNSLFLLDEPETHFNPDWRSLFISTLRDCLEQEQEKYLSDIIITSHSPFIVSDCFQDNVIVFEKAKSKKGNLKISRPDFNTFGASVNLLTHKIFHKEETISEIANKRLKDVLKDFKANKINVQEAIKRANQLGDSIEKLIIIDELKRIENKVKKKK